MANGKFQISKGSYGVDVEWESAANAAANASTVTVAVYIRYYSMNIGERICRCKIDGNTQEAGVEAISHSGSAQRKLAHTFTFEVPHGQDGTKTCELKAGFYFDLTSGNYGYIGWLEAGGEITLDTIPRAAVLTATGGVIGAAAVFSWTPNAEDHHFLLKIADWEAVRFDPESIAPEVYRLALTEAFTAYMAGTPPQATLCATLETYQGQELLGESTAEFSVTMPPYSLPAVAVRECYRANADGAPDVEGTYLYLEAECYISPYKKDGTQINQYTVYCAVNGVTVYAGDEPSAIVQNVSLDTTQAYEVQIWTEDLTDRSVISTVNIPTAAADFHLRRGGKGAAFGCYATKENAVQLAPGWTLYLGEQTLAEYIKSLI